MSATDAAVNNAAESHVHPNGSQPHARSFTHYNHANFRDMLEGEGAQAFGGSLQIGQWRPYEHRKLANPAPLGLSAFALTTFVLSALNMHARNTADPHIVISLAFGYGGLVQLLAGMWEMATGNTFGATALSSYGGFWISYAIILTQGFHVLDSYTPAQTANVLGFYLMGWFIFTFILMICTLRSTVALFLLFFTLDLAFLFLACEQFATNLGSNSAALGLQKAGGLFGFLAAFLAWYNALAGIQDSTNSFFQVPVIHFPWSDQAQEVRTQKAAEHQA